jgi:hypothetical protein
MLLMLYIGGGAYPVGGRMVSGAGIQAVQAGLLQLLVFVAMFDR